MHGASLLLPLFPQGSKWMVVLRPWLQPSPRPRLDPVFNCGLGTRVPAAGAGQCQGGSARGPAAAVGDEALLCIYDMADSTWVQPQHVQVVASSSGSSLLREAAGEQGGGANPAVACSQYFAAQGQDAAGWGPAAAAAAAAARGALKDHSLEPHAGAAAVFRRQRQQAAALMVDAVGELVSRPVLAGVAGVCMLISLDQ